MPYLRCGVDGQGFRALVKGNHLGESLQPVPRSVVGPGLYAESKNVTRYFCAHYTHNLIREIKTSLSARTHAYFPACTTIPPLVHSIACPHHTLPAHPPPC